MVVDTTRTHSSVAQLQTADRDPECVDVSMPPHGPLGPSLRSLCISGIQNEKKIGMTATETAPTIRFMGTPIFRKSVKR